MDREEGRCLASQQPQCVELATWGAVAGKYGTVVDWLGPFVNFKALQSDQSSWERFWLNDVAVTDVPREWFIWAMSVGQMFRKVTPGTPGDSQIASYFPDVEGLITADKRMASCVEDMRPRAPIATPRLFNCRQSDVVTDIASAVHELSQREP